MARPTKYSPEITEQLISYLKEGFTVRDACYGVGISEDTVCRWRHSHPDFAEQVKGALSYSYRSPSALVQSSGYRRYRVKQNKAQKADDSIIELSNCYQAPNVPYIAFKTLSEAFEQYTEGTYNAVLDLPVRDTPPIDEYERLLPCEPYLNETTNAVEWVKEGILHSCPVELWGGTRQD